MNDSTVTQLVRLAIAPTPDPMAQSIEELVEASEKLGATRERYRLRLLGEVHCLAPDISEAEFLGVLARGGLCVSSVDGVQLIHRAPRPAA